ncbi:hypothetical protein [Rhodothermus marinus]|uniref:Translation initiation factor IF-2 n=1 Tax=Rhodothermus marinus (strain ATCC 43812 / DSM 4252 / R-10) TaxID=518766 RepID=D0MD10_RHOM4|nr:hypothetical protein [Rhodothermus marinus]ACY47120.1 translation initiation factor IF-2 [Rhodothermus marinus DSM 4252]
MHDEQIRRLIEQFRARFLELSSEEIQRLIEEAKAEALAEARAIIKEQMLEAILEQSARLQTRSAAAQPASSAAAPTSSPRQPEPAQRSPFETPRVTLVSRPETPPAPEKKTSRPSPEPATVEAAEQNGAEIDGARKILREIENLRQQLSANEEWLKRAGGSGPGASDYADES